MLALKFIGWILKALKEGPTPGQIAGGILLGFIIGVIPGWPVQIYAVILLILIIKVNLPMVIIGWVSGFVIAVIVDPLFDAVGGLLLEMPALQGLWTAMYNSPPAALTHFNNTVVLGSFVVGVIFAIIAFPILSWGVRVYRERFLTRIAKFKFVQLLMGSRWGARIFGFYNKLSQLGFV